MIVRRIAHLNVITSSHDPIPWNILGCVGLLLLLELLLLFLGRFKISRTTTLYKF